MTTGLSGKGTAIHKVALNSWTGTPSDLSVCGKHIDKVLEEGRDIVTCVRCKRGAFIPKAR